MSTYGGYEDHPFIAELYDYVPGYAGRRDVEFCVEYARSAGGPVLELGSGTGRVLIPAAAAGCRIVGLDLSEYMLAECRRKLAAQPDEVRKRVRLVQGDMTAFDLGESFSLITMPFRPFQHLLLVESQLACLRCANRHLVMGGKLILDLFQVKLHRITGPAPTEEAEEFSGVELPDGKKFARASRIVAYHRAEQFNDVEHIYYVTHPGGRTERLVHAFPFRYFFRYEVEHLLARCGFRVAALYGNYDRSPLVDDSPEMIFVAEKGDKVS